ncbi:hypothetical protein [Pantoea dispersa]|uniref:hypothetical protein n=1 Tax=Pantoea dispersa TaxID=59814 RepID=UPI0013E3DDEB|nr:hypothetical protein [Pantoea dispersa]MDR6298236.1 hypothetical protein [Pantoea dispersa]
MKDLAVVALAQLPAAIFALGAVWLASKNISGWGWFIFAALCVASTKVKVS